MRQLVKVPKIFCFCFFKGENKESKGGTFLGLSILDPRTQSWKAKNTIGEIVVGEWHFFHSWKKKGSIRKLGIEWPERLLLSVVLLLFFLQFLVQKLKYTGHAAIRSHFVLRVTCDLITNFKLENCKLKMEGHSPADTRAISLAGPPIGLSSGRPDETQLRPI